MVTIVTRTLFPAHLMPEMEELTERSLPVFAKQDGFVGMEVLRSSENDGTLTIFRWESIADHENCMKSVDWEDLNPKWEEFLGREEVQFEFLFNGSRWK